ncbi:uncharacterized protein [Anabrus simplex]|uniref:uncharacterized protein n=1 Tax=Anabrus simplex TaxID=316456 RepID=UPI0035A293E7
MENEQKLKAMRNCRRISSRVFLERCEKQLQILEPDMVCLVGPKNKEMTSSLLQYQQEQQQQQLQQQSLLIDVTQVWQRIYCRKWIVGISVNNTAERSIDELNLILTHEDGELLNYSTQIFSCKADLSTGDALSEKWQNVTTVPRKTKAVVMGILKQPAFLKNPEVTITGVITYSYKAPDDSKSDHQLPVPNFTFNAEEFSQKLLVPFTGDEIEDADLLSVMAAGEHVTLAVNNVHCALQEILQLELGFEVLRWGCVFHKQSLRPMLGGMLIWIENNLHNSYSVDIYARDVAQIFLLVHCLYAVLRVDSDIYLASPAQTQVNARIFYDTVCSEVDFVTSKFIEWTEKYENMETNDMESETSIKIPRNIFADFIRNYQELELSTDLLNVQI